MNYKTLIISLSTYIPGVYHYLIKVRNSSDGGATSSARYCYSVWLRHLVMAKANGLINSIPKTVAELGPGDTIGVGIAALLSGSDEYYSLDVVQHSNLSKNISILEELIQLFQERCDIPDDKEWPNIFPKLKNYSFPSDILNEEILEKSLTFERIQNIKDAINKPDDYSGPITIQSYVPWNNPDIIKKKSVDFCLSQAVMEHIENLDKTYYAIHQWLKTNGIMSLEIDFSNHVMADKWNEHWKYSNFIFDKIIWGNRPYCLNREPFSKHTQLTYLSLIL